MARLQLTLALLKPDLVARPMAARAVRRAILTEDFVIVRRRQLVCSMEEAGRFYSEHHGTLPAGRSRYAVEALYDEFIEVSSFQESRPRAEGFHYIRGRHGAENCAVCTPRGLGAGLCAHHVGWGLGCVHTTWAGAGGCVWPRGLGPGAGGWAVCGHVGWGLILRVCLPLPVAPVVTIRQSPPSGPTCYCASVLPQVDSSLIVLCRT